jgi:hypothetical protein
MLNLIKKFKINFLILKNIFLIADKEIKFVFYSENKFYQKYSYPIIKLLSEKYSKQVYYASSEIDDQININDINNLYIGKGLLMRIFFSIIKAEYFFLTLTDLDNHFIKKNKNVKKYIYYFHGAGSTFKGYTEKAFDNYDIILCNGQFQKDEIEYRENLKKLKKKKLILTGYFYFDYVHKKINLEKKASEILLAPSWTYKHTNYINENCILIIEHLLKKKYKVTFRPHPEHFKRSQNILQIIKNKFKSYEYFKFDESIENLKSMENAKCLITENSGFFLEYMLVLNRPVLFLDDGIDKIHNKNFNDFKNFKALEVEFRNQFCKTFSKVDIPNIENIIEDSIKNFNSKVLELNSLRDRNYYNFKNTIEKFQSILENQIMRDN